MTELSKWSRLGQSLAIQRQFATHARRMAPGSLGGRTESASPATAVRGMPVAGRPAASGGAVLGHIVLELAGSQSIPNASPTQLVFSQVREESGDHGLTNNGGGASGDWTCEPGYYVMHVGVNMQGAASGYSSAWIDSNWNVTIPNLTVPNNAAGTVLCVGAPMAFPSGDAGLLVDVEQSSGGPLTVNANLTWWTIFRLGAGGDAGG